MDVPYHGNVYFSIFYSRSGDDAQMLKFPTTKNILWDHTKLGDAQTLHISYFR